ncbi:MAG: PQQ-binding-like beta-propeller repeat protein, partial [Pirellulales bacterium]
GVKMPQSMGLGGFTKPPKVNIQWQVQCIDVQSGKQIWATTASTGNPKFPVHPSNTYATETPVVDENGIVAFFGATGTLAAMDHAGALRWQHDLGAFATDSGFGTGSSIAIHKGIVFVQHFTKGSSIVAAFDTKTGEQRWKHERKGSGSSWSSPMVWNNTQRSELIVSGGELIESLDPANGAVLWQLGKVKAPTACSIAADSQRIYFGGSDPLSKGPLFAMSAGASGDITPKKMNTSFDHCDWLEFKAGPGMPSPVSDGKFVYVLDNNILRTYDASSGKRAYQTRVPDLNQVASSPLVIGDKLLAIDDAGKAVLVQTGGEFKVIGGGSLSDTFWSTPAVSQGAIYFRGVNSLYCVRKM